MPTWNDVKRSTIDVRDGRLAYYRVGSGPDLVCVHGWPLHAATFRHLVPRLAGSFTLHMLDLPGTGSSSSTGPLSFRASARALAEALRTLDLPAYTLFGHDSGGAMARRVAAEDPRVRGLILEDTEIPHSKTALLVALIAACRMPLIERLFPWALQQGPFRRSMFGFGACFTDPAYVDGDFADLFVTPLAQPSVARPQMELGKSFDLAFIDELAEVHPRLKMPVLCIWGEDDPYFPVEAARVMAQQLPGPATFVTIPKARLLPHEDHPDQVAAAIRAFMATSATSASRLSASV
jgi:pimeloyl-ACP methyl ester carboxylesterase